MGTGRPGRPDRPLTGRRPAAGLAFRGPAGRGPGMFGQTTWFFSSPTENYKLLHFYRALGNFTIRKRPVEHRLFYLKNFMRLYLRYLNVTGRRPAAGLDILILLAAGRPPAELSHFRPAPAAKIRNVPISTLQYEKPVEHKAYFF